MQYAGLDGISNDTRQMPQMISNKDQVSYPGLDSEDEDWGD